ncbi:MAG: hypothetical protein JXA18_02725 [Chitinispirillaceae bacterium]|nr:hypothetical protein [Chitinispirillaceae bacterium]
MNNSSEFIFIRNLHRFAAACHYRMRNFLVGMNNSFNGEFAALVVMTICIILYKHFTYIGIAHDARLYASDLCRVPSMAPQDMLSTSPQYKGTIFPIVFMPFCKAWSIEAFFHAAHLLFGVGNFLLTYFLLKTIIRHTLTVNIVLAAFFNIVQWEVIAQTIHLNEPFFTVRPVSFFLLQLALLLGMVFHRSNKSHYLFGSGFCAGLSFSFHPITALYFFSAYLAFSPKTYRSLFVGALCGLVPFILMRIFYMGDGVAIVSQNGEWTPQLILLITRNNRYLFPSMWREMSQSKIFSTVFFLFFLSFIYRKETLGKIAFISTLFCGTLMALYVIADYFQIDNAFFISIQPMRAFSILNLYLYFLLAKWMTDARTDFPPQALRIMVFCIFIILAYCVSIELSLQLAAVAALWPMFPPLHRNKYLQWLVLIIFLIEGCTEIFPLFYLLGFDFKPIHLLFIFFSTAVIILLRKRLTVCFCFVAATTMVLQINHYVRQKYSVCMPLRRVDALASLQRNIDHGSTVVFLPASRTLGSMDLSPLRYSRKHFRVFVTLVDKGPACFSAHYAREYLRRKNRTEFFGTVNDSKQLREFLKSENIQYVISPIERPLRLVDTYRGLKLYALN